MPKNISSEKEQQERKIGGPLFYLSLVCLSLLALLNLAVLPGLFAAAFHEAGFTRIALSGAGGALAGIAASFLLRGRIGVFLHELKHSILSNFAGNKAKSFKYDEGGGHFEYKYKKSQAYFNTFIALAPYWLPIFTAPVIVCTLCLGVDGTARAAAFVAFCYALDLALALHDVHPAQSDLTSLRGGYTVGLWYIAAVNIFTGTIAVAWIFMGRKGALYLFSALWLLVRRLYV